MLRLKNPRIRRGMFTYTDPDTGIKLGRRSFPAVVEEAAKYRKANKLPIPINFAAIVEHNYCVVNPDLCEEADRITLAVATQEPEIAIPPPSGTPNIAVAPTAPITHFPPALEQVRNFFRTSAEWAKSGFRRSTKDEAEKRLLICVQCEFWNGARNILSFRCRKCGCCMRIKVGMGSAHCPVGKW